MQTDIPEITQAVLDTLPTAELGAAIASLAQTLGVQVGNGDFTLAQLIELPETATLLATQAKLLALRDDARISKKAVSRTLRGEISALEFRLRQCERRDAARAERQLLGPEYLDCWCLGALGRRPTPIPIIENDEIVMPSMSNETVMQYMRTCTCPEGVRAEGEAAQAQLALRSWVEARDIERILGKSGIPARYLGLDLDTWIGAALSLGAEETETDAVELALEQWYAQVSDPPAGEYAHVLLLAGAAGAGKTGLAIALGSRFAQRRKSVVFRTVSDFYAELRAAPWRERDAETQPTEQQLMTAMRTADLLILDDWGAEAITDANEQKLVEALNSVLDARLREMRPTILTTNLPGTLLTERVGARLMQRVRPDAISKKVVFKTPNLRGS